MYPQNFQLEKLLENESFEREHIQNANYGERFPSPVNQEYFSSWMHMIKLAKNYYMLSQYLFYYRERLLGNGVHFAKFPLSQLWVSCMPNVVKIESIGTDSNNWTKSLVLWL